MQGYSLLELLTVVAIMGILAAVGVPAYQGYSQTAKDTVAQNGVRAIYMQQQEYFLNNNAYYNTGGASCAADADNTAIINTNLFSGKQVLAGNADGFYFCIFQATVNDFTAVADEVGTARTFTITQTNTTNF